MIDPNKLSPIDLRGAAAQLRGGALAPLLDSTVLAPTATSADITRLVEEAVGAGAQVCVNECRIAQAIELKAAFGPRGRATLISGVIGFPLGACTTAIKTASARELLDTGADEIDMVTNIGYLVEGSEEVWKEDVAAVAETVGAFNAVHTENRGLKVIIETCYLSNAQKEFAAAAAAEIGLKQGIPVFVKTSTGFGRPAPGVAVGATVHDVLLIRRTVGDYCAETNPVGVKASGGIRSATDMLKMALAAGAFDENLRLRSDAHLAARIGASGVAAILRDFDEIYAPRGWLSPSSY